MSDEDRPLGKLLHFPNRARSFVRGQVMITETVDDLDDILMAMKDDAGKFSAMIFPPPAGHAAWELCEPEHLEALGRYCIQLAALIRLDGQIP